MPRISVTLLASNVPVNGLLDAPEITIQRLDTGAEVVADAAMTDQTTRGMHVYDFTTADPVLQYRFLIDADPNVTGQVDVRYWSGQFDTKDEQIRDMLEADEVYDDTGNTLRRLRRGTSTDLIPAKDVVGTNVGADTSLVQP